MKSEKQPPHLSYYSVLWIRSRDVVHRGSSAADVYVAGFHPSFQYINPPTRGYQLALTYPKSAANVTG